MPEPATPSDTAYVIFTAQVGQKSTDAFILLCTELMSKGTGHVYLLLSSPGGNVMLGITLYNLMRSFPLKFTAHNIGNVDSIALLLYLAADTRYSARSSTFMFHGVGIDTKAPLRLEERLLAEKLEAFRADHKRLAGIVIDRAKFKDQSEVTALYAQEATKDVEWAKAVGIVHEIRDPQIPKGSVIHRIASTD